MPDQGFHEIQLSGKQLFFFFMCAVVLAAVIFLLGVSVGRDLRATPFESAQARTEPDNPAPSAVPPPTQTAPNELSYAQALQGGAADSAKVTTPASSGSSSASSQKPDTSPPAPPKTEPAPVPAAEPPKAEAPKTTEARSEPKSEPPPKTGAGKNDAPRPAPPAPAAKSDANPAAVDPTSGFSLQMGAFNTEAAAGAMIANLKRRGYSASLVTMPENTDVRFRVYVGPYRSRVDAQRAQSRLEKEGFKSLIKR